VVHWEVEQPTVSVICGTYNRFPSLKRAIESVRKSVLGLTYEIVVTDGGSRDGSREWLAVQDDVVLVGKRSLEGAVKAFNEAWAASRGKYVANFNDDAEYVDDALVAAVRYLESPPGAKAGQVAFEYDLPGVWKVETINGLYYANFGMTRREVVERICQQQGGPNNFWNPIYHTYAADCEHSCWVWKLGLEVHALKARCADKKAVDELREKNDVIRGARGDSELFWKRWPDSRSMRP
jgi:glycosyltransferase involved in cell wall biosynthesis